MHKNLELTDNDLETLVGKICESRIVILLHGSWLERERDNLIPIYVLIYLDHLAGRKNGTELICATTYANAGHGQGHTKSIKIYLFITKIQNICIIDDKHCLISLLSLFICNFVIGILLGGRDSMLIEFEPFDYKLIQSC